jgi:hypothetical protein
MGVNTTLSTSTAVCWEAEEITTGVTLYKLGDCTGTPADLAEFYPSASSGQVPQSGEIVSISNPLGSYTTSDGVSHQAFGVEKAISDTSHKMAGVVSTKAWQVMGEDVLDWANQTVQVALTGRVPLKIAPSSASITAGDMITVSDDTPGAGKKSDGNGYIIGKALENWDPTNPTPTILVFLQNSVNIAGLLANNTEQTTDNIGDRVNNLETEIQLLKAANLTSSASSATQTPDLSVQNLTVLDSSILGDVTITGGLTVASLTNVNFNNNIIIDQKGNLSIKNGVILGNDNFRGELTVSANATTFRVDKTWESAPVSITVTPNWNTTVWVTEKGQSGFTVNFGSPAPSDVRANWTAIW